MEDLDKEHNNEREESSLYSLATTEIERIIKIYLTLVEDTNNFENVTAENLRSLDERIILLAGLRSLLDPLQTTPEDVVLEWERRRAIPFDIETSVTTGVYLRLRKVAADYYDALQSGTNMFSSFSAQFIRENPQYLPLLQHIGRFPSKSKLKEEIGSVSDASISAPAAQRLADYLSNRVDPQSVSKEQILIRLSSTLEGIVRDLVGRVLLESVVASALEDEGLEFQREEQYDRLTGVIYDFRADFVLPNAQKPLVFIEVRKSSSRHASLYAKDKMFSAINWKGKHKNLLGVLVVDGPWTATTLDIMTRVFDYVVPLSGSAKLAKTIASYLQGDTSKLKWMIDFEIKDAASAQKEG